MMGLLGLFASRICGSADIYTKPGKGPEGSINFVTCHDGFTLNDLVSYRNKHNEANGEDNHDGTDYNFSENYGAEGESTDAAINCSPIGSLTRRPLYCWPKSASVTLRPEPGMLPLRAPFRASRRLELFVVVAAVVVSFRSGLPVSVFAQRAHA